MVSTLTTPNYPMCNKDNRRNWKHRQWESTHCYKTNTENFLGKVPFHSVICTGQLGQNKTLKRQESKTWTKKTHTMSHKLTLPIHTNHATQPRIETSHCVWMWLDMHTVNHTTNACKSRAEKLEQHIIHGYLHENCCR